MDFLTADNDKVIFRLGQRRQIPHVDARDWLKMS
jgi:hypothetical protein